MIHSEPVRCPGCGQAEVATGGLAEAGGFYFSHQCSRCHLLFDDETPAVPVVAPPSPALVPEIREAA